MAEKRRRSDKSQAAEAIAARSVRSDPFSRFASTARVRRCTSSRGMSMRTGHTSKQAPHSVEAYGSDSATSSEATSRSWGTRTAPIGPG